MRTLKMDSSYIAPTRRAFLAGAAIAAAAPGASAAAIRRFSGGVFSHSVASGDPDATSFVVWTRFATKDAMPGRIGWEVAEQDTFTKVVRSGDLTISPADDFCARTLVKGLRPGRRYFYRFLGADGPSPTGQSRTAPSGSIDDFTFAAFSCSNLPFGYFHAYADAAARDDIELCLHLGDYLYEPARGIYPGAAETIPGRMIEPAGELITYADYCARYASYRADPDLQELHRVKPWAVIWDDHEIANDAWVNGAGAHDPLTEGGWAARKAAAVKAYLDWMPIRHAPTDGLRIYRRLDWGNLASVMLLDTRLIGRDQQFDLRGAMKEPLEKGGDALRQAAAAFAHKLGDPKRTLLGAAQERWLAEQLRQSKSRGAPWQVLAQQVVMGRQIMPAAAPKFLQSTVSEGSKEFAARGAAVGAFDIPWNMDSWSGYPAARERLLGACAHHGANVLALAGDSHSAWAHNLPDGEAGTKDGVPAAVELGVTSVTSPGLEKTFSNAAPGEREDAIRLSNSELAWCDVTQRGYCITKLTKSGAEAAFVQLSQVSQKERPIVSSKMLYSETRPGRGVGAWKEN